MEDAVKVLRHASPPLGPMERQEQKLKGENGQVLVPVQGSRQTVNVDLSKLRQREYAVMRSGERIAVIGVASDDGRRLIATSIIRNLGTPGSYQAP